MGITEFHDRLYHFFFFFKLTYITVSHVFFCA